MVQGRPCIRPPDRPQGPWVAQACLCPDPGLVYHLQSCGPRHRDCPEPEHVHRGGSPSKTFMSPLHCRHHLGAEFCGCLSFSVRPWLFRTAEPFYLKGGLCRVELRAYPCPLGGWQKHPQRWPAFPTSEGSRGLDLWKMENQAQKVLNFN